MTASQKDKKQGTCPLGMINNHVSQAYIGGTWDGGVIFAGVWVYCKVATELE